MYAGPNIRCAIPLLIDERNVRHWVGYQRVDQSMKDLPFKFVFLLLLFSQPHGASDIRSKKRGIGSFDQS